MLLDDLLEDIPIEYRERYEALHARALGRTDALRAELNVYLDTVRQVASVAVGMDLVLAERLATVLLQLVEHTAGDSEERRKVVDAAVTYFVQEEEDEEITGVLGFDDDIQVVNAVARAVGRPDLSVPLAR